MGWRDSNVINIHIIVSHLDYLIIYGAYPSYILELDQGGMELTLNSKRGAVVDKF